MSGFVAEDVAKEFDYDLGEGRTGRVPMPSLAEVRKFRERYDNATEKVRLAVKARVDALPEDASEEDRTVAGRATAEERDEHMDEILEAVIDVCNGSPDRDTLTALPAPIKLAFAGWLSGELAPLL